MEDYILEIVQYIYKHCKLKHLHYIALKCIAVIICRSGSVMESSASLSLNSVHAILSRQFVKLNVVH